MNVDNIPKAYKEVYTILKYVEIEDLKLIPKEFINMLRQNMDKDYEFEYNPKIDFEKQNLLRETKGIFAYIFLNFWANEKQRKVIKQTFKNDINVI